MKWITEYKRLGIKRDHDAGTYNTKAPSEYDAEGA